MPETSQSVTPKEVRVRRRSVRPRLESLPQDRQQAVAKNIIFLFDSGYSPEYIASRLWVKAADVSTVLFRDLRRKMPMSETVALDRRASRVVSIDSRKVA